MNSPRRRFVFQTEISGKYIVLALNSPLFYFLSSLRRGDQSTVFCIVSSTIHLPAAEEKQNGFCWYIVTKKLLFGRFRFPVTDSSFRFPDSGSSSGFQFLFLGLLR